MKTGHPGKQFSFIFDCLFLLSFSMLLLIVPLEFEHRVVPGARVQVVHSKDGHYLLKDGKPFIIRGASGEARIPELADMGANTLRIYDTTNLGRILDEADEYGISVIVDIPVLPYSEQYDYYQDPIKNRQLCEDIRKLVRKYKDHPALLVWTLGNEVHYPLVLRKNQFIKTYNTLIDIIHAEDPDHPVSTTLPVAKRQLLGMVIHSPKIDLIGFNVFGQITSMSKHLSLIDPLVRIPSFYLSEWGYGGPWEAEETLWGAVLEPTSTKKIEQLHERYQRFSSDKYFKYSVGRSAFYWGHKTERTHTWFSTFNREGYRSEMVREFRNQWNENPQVADPIGLNYMLLDGSGAASNLIFSEGETKLAQLVFLGEKPGALNIQWELYPEEWDFRQWGAGKQADAIPDAIITTENNDALIKIPQTKGAYRLFAQVVDPEGYYASANIPFYVINKQDAQ